VEALNIRGQQHVSFVLDGRKLDHTFLVCPIPTEAEDLLGTDFLDRTGAEINFECGKLSLAGNYKAPTAGNGMSEDRAALTVFPEHEMGRKPQGTRPVEPHLDKQSLDNPCSIQTTQWSRSWLVRATENITLVPRCRQVVTAKIELEKERSFPLLVCVKPATIPLEGILTARELSRVGTSVHETLQPGRAMVMLANFSHDTLTLPKSTVLGVAEEVSEELVDKTNKPEQTSFDSPARPRRKRRNEALYNKILGGKLDHLPPEGRQKMEPMLQKYAYVFHDEETNDFKSTNVMEHQILLEDEKPIRRPQYKTPLSLRAK